MTAPPRFEVVREHPATGRSQLHAWDFIVKGAAENEATLMNDQARANQGRTLAHSGLLETGWIYRARQQGETDAAPVNGAGKNGTGLNGVTARGRRATKRGRASP